MRAGAVFVGFEELLFSAAQRLEWLTFVWKDPPLHRDGTVVASGNTCERGSRPGRRSHVGGRCRAECVSTDGEETHGWRIRLPCRRISPTNSREMVSVCKCRS